MSQKNINFEHLNFIHNQILDTLFSQNYKDIRIIELKNNTYHDYVIVCTANSIAQINPIVKKLKIKFNSDYLDYEGYNSNWLLISLKGFLIQIFTNESREYYNIEDIYFDSLTIAKFG